MAGNRYELNDQSDLAIVLEGLIPARRIITSDYTIVAADSGTLIVYDGSETVTLTVPEDLSSDFECAVAQKGAGAVLIAAPSEPIHPLGHNGTGGPLSTVSLIALGDDKFSLTGQTTRVTEPGAPVLTGGNAFTISEGAANGAYVGFVAFGGENVTLSITGPFAIDSQTGEITKSGTIDYETTTSYTPTITATNTSGSVQATVTVNVTNVPPPTVVAGQRFAAFDNASNGTILGTLQANRAVTGWSLAAGPFSVDSAGVLTKSGTLNAGTQALYTLNATATDVEGSSTPVAITIDVIAAGATYDPGGAGAVGYWDPADSGHRTTSGAPTQIDALANILATSGYALNRVNAQSLTTSPLLGVANMGTIDSAIIADKAQLAAVAGSALKGAAQNVSAFFFEGMIELTAELASEIIRFSTNGSAGSSRFAMRTDVATGAPRLQLVTRRLDADTAITLTHSMDLHASTRYYIAGGVLFSTGSAFLIVNGVIETFALTFTSGNGNSQNSASNGVFLGYSNSILSYEKIGKFAIYQAIPDEAKRNKNAAILRALYGA